MTGGWTSSLPPDGVWRVHPSPELLPRAPKFEEGEIAQSRFDDPAGQYRVRYAATTLRGCLLEVLSASFRLRRPLEERLAAVTNADAAPEELLDLGEPKELEEPGRVPEAWLDRQKVTRLQAGYDGLAFVNVMDAGFLAEYTDHPRIRRSIVRHLGEQYDLDAGTIMLNLHHGRPVTQAVSAVVWEESANAGIRYLSRLDLNEECWAIFDRTVVTWDEPQALHARNDEHRLVLQDVARLLHLILPDTWRD